MRHQLSSSSTGCSTEAHDETAHASHLVGHHRDRTDRPIMIELLLQMVYFYVLGRLAILLEDLT